MTKESEEEFFIFDDSAGDIEVEPTIISAGEELNLEKLDPTMSEIMIGAGWDLKPFDAQPIDLDVSCFLLDKDGKTRENSDFVFYNAMQGADGAIIHNGDSRTGAGDGDDETISVDLRGISFEVLRVVFVLTIYDATAREHNLDGVRGGFLRIVDMRNSHEIARYVLDDELKDKKEEGMIVAQLERSGQGWKFKALGESIEGGLSEIAKRYDIIVAEDNG